MKEKNFYIVKTKCGHVGKDKFILKDFPVKAFSKKEAARIARYIPRVKHHWKDAIVSVEQVCDIEYESLRKKNSNDPFLCATNIQEQRIYCYNLDIIDQTNINENKRTKRASVYYRLKKMRIIEESYNYA